MFDLTALVWLAALALLILYVARAMAVREQAFSAARRHYQQMEVQMLDQSVYLRRLWLKRNRAGRLSLWRAFYFEFTVDGSDRYLGRVLMLGRQIEQVELQPHRIH